MTPASTTATSATVTTSEAPSGALHGRIMAELGRIRGPVSTAEVRDCLNQSDPARPVVIERVYAVLVALEHKGAVRRARNAIRTRPLWELAPAPTPTEGLDAPAGTAPAAAETSLTAVGLDERITRLDGPPAALALAEVILAPWDGATWERWRPLATAPLAGWLYAASHTDAAGNRIDWIIRALAHRAQWSRAAHRVGEHPQLRDSLRSVSRLDDHQFTNVGWMLVLALFPWSSCLHPPAAAFVGHR